MEQPKIIAFINKLSEHTEKGKISWKTDGQDTTFFVDDLSNEYKVKLVVISHQADTPIFGFSIVRLSSQVNLIKVFPGTKLHDSIFKLYDTLYMKQTNKGVAKLEVDGKPEGEKVDIMSAFDFLKENNDGE